jgi:hypothetical protein
MSIRHLPTRLEAFEVTRRLANNSRPLFNLLGGLVDLVDTRTGIIHAQSGTASIDTISAYDGIDLAQHPVLDRRRPELESLMDIRRISTCHDYASIKLGKAVLLQMGAKNSIIAAEIIDSNKDFAKERLAMTSRIDEIIGCEQRWDIPEPVLRLADFYGDDNQLDNAMSYLNDNMPETVDLFDASPRHRSIILT